VKVWRVFSSKRGSSHAARLSSFVLRLISVMTTILLPLTPDQFVTSGARGTSGGASCGRRDLDALATRGDTPFVIDAVQIDFAPRSRSAREEVLGEGGDPRPAIVCRRESIVAASFTEVDAQQHEIAGRRAPAPRCSEDIGLCLMRLPIVLTGEDSNTRGGGSANSGNTPFHSAVARPGRPGR